MKTSDHLSTSWLLLVGMRGVAVILLLLAILGPGVARCDTLLVATGSKTIRQFSLTGQDLGIFASTGLSSPESMALDRSGNLYVVDLRSNTVHEFSFTGDDLGIFVSAGFNEPVSLAFDLDGNLFVGNIGDNAIHKFSSTGQDLGVFTSLLGSGCPEGLAFEPSGDLLVADGCRNLIRRFLPTGQERPAFASVGLSNPFRLAFNAAGILFVVYGGGQFANTIHKFSPTGQDLGTFTSTGLNFPVGLAFDKSGNLYVANGAQRAGHTDYSIREFSPTGIDLGDFALLSDQPVDLVISPSLFTTMTSSLNPSIYGQKVTFAATVKSAGGTPTGKVNFTWKDGTEQFSIGSAMLDASGLATLTRSNLNADSFPLVAKYSGDANNSPSSSAILNQVVQQTTSTATITPSLNPSTKGQSVTFTAKITSPTVIPSGPVIFKTGTTVLGAAQLSGGRAILTTSSLPVGSTRVTVSYAGNSNIAKSSASVTQVVQP